MKFQDSSFNGLKVTVGTKSVTHAPTHAPKAICPINFFKVGGIIIIKYHQICTVVVSIQVFYSKHYIVTIQLKHFMVVSIAVQVNLGLA